MHLTNTISLVGSGDIGGFSLSHPLDCHVYLLDGGEELALVDAGSGQEPGQILSNVIRDGYDTAKIHWLLLTHAHFDHAGGAAALRQRLDLKVVAGKHTALIMRDGDAEANGLAPLQRVGLYPADIHFDPCPVDMVVHDGEQIQVGQLTLRVLATPGHSADHTSYLVEGKEQTLFSGDALLAGGKILLQALPDVIFSDYQVTLHKLSTLEIEHLLPSHGILSLARSTRHLGAALASLKHFSIPPNATLD